MAKNSFNDEQRESLLRIPIGILSCIIIGVWKFLVILLMIVNFFYTLITGKRNRDMAEFSEYWNTEAYKLARYLTFVSNERPFPFTSMQRMSKFTK